MVRFRVLGPVDVFVDGAPVRLRPQERRLLALLLCRPNRPVPTEDLVDELWNGSPPATARTAIRVHVERTRAEGVEVPEDQRTLTSSAHEDLDDARAYGVLPRARRLLHAL